MSEEKNNSKFRFFISSKFWYGMVAGGTLVMFVAYIPVYPAIIDNMINPITADDCKYGLHQDFFGSRCIYHHEMQEILGCDDFFLRSGYWWTCKEGDIHLMDWEMKSESEISKITTENMTGHDFYLEMPSDRFFNVDWQNDPVEIWWALHPENDGGIVSLKNFTVSVSGLENNEWIDESSYLILTTSIPNSDDALQREKWHLTELEKSESNTEKGFDYFKNFDQSIVMKNEGRDSPVFNLFLDFNDFHKETGYEESKVIHVRFEVLLEFADGYKVSTSDAVYVTFFDSYKPEPHEYSEWYFNNVGDAFS